MATRTNHQSLREVTTVTIAINTTTSSACFLGGFDLVGIGLPTVTSTSLLFYGSDDGGTTYKALVRQAGTAVSYTIATNKIITVNPVDMNGCSHVKVVVDTSEAAARTLNFITKKVY